jgi:hypothetical protein
MYLQKLFTVIALVYLINAEKTNAQFIDNFDSSSTQIDHPGAIDGWTFYTGDGKAVMDFKQGNGYASIIVDATKDKQNIWWALIRRGVFEFLDLEKLALPNYGLRLEAHIRVSNAPRRINLHFNTQKTSDFHSHLIEYDIPETVNWHTISMTTHQFGARSGDSVYAQLALMDWGLDKYHVDVDYFNVDVVNIDSCGPDLGAEMPYHPPIPPVNKFKNHIQVIDDCSTESQFPDRNLND